MSAPRLAVVLAAGRGVRLGALGEEMPKGFLRVTDVPLIERSIDALRAAGIDRIRIVTGHLSHYYEQLAAKMGRSVTLSHNPDFATTGSLVSLLCAGPIDEPYLIVESDLLYERRAPRLLIDAPHDDLLLASGPTGSGDEVYVGAENGHLVDLTKKLDELRGERVGELVGLTRVSPALHRQLTEQGRRLLQDTQRVEYEAALVAASCVRPIPVLVADDLVWTEVDDETHLARARTQIVPRLD